MRRSKHKYGGATPPKSVHTWIKVDDIKNNLKLIWHSHSQTIFFNSTKSWELCLRRMRPHNWYWIIPSHSSSADDICFGIGQKWGLIAPLLFDLSYLFGTGGVGGGLKLIY